jgi:hypothetical protein
MNNGFAVLTRRFSQYRSVFRTVDLRSLAVNHKAFCTTDNYEHKKKASPESVVGSQ